MKLIRYRHNLTWRKERHRDSLAMFNKRIQLIYLKYDTTKWVQFLAIFHKVSQVSSPSHTCCPDDGSAEPYSTGPVTGRLRLCNKKSSDSPKIIDVVKRESVIGQSYCQGEYICFICLSIPYGGVLLSIGNVDTYISISTIDYETFVMTQDLFLFLFYRSKRQIT